MPTQLALRFDQVPVICPVQGKLSATVHDFSGTIMHALLPKAYDASKRSAYLDRWHVGLDREWQEWLSFLMTHSARRNQAAEASC